MHVFVHFVQNSDLWKYDESKIKGLFKTITMNMASRHWHLWLKNRPDTLRKLAIRIREKSIQEPDNPTDRDVIRLESLKNCLARLSAPQRQIIEACYFKNTSYAQLAQTTGKSVTALYKTMSRIRAFLYDCIRKTAGKESDL